MSSGSIDRSGFAPGVWARRILLPYGLARPGAFRANAPSSLLLCRLRRQYTRASGSIQFLKISFSASAGRALVEEPEEIQVALVR